MFWCVLVLGFAAGAAAAALLGFWIGVRVRSRIRLPRFTVPRYEPLVPCCPVAMYHAPDTKMFETALCYLRRNGYETIDLDRLADWLEGADVTLPEKPIILTFDDGWESVYTQAYPLLKEFGYTAVAYVCPGLVSIGKPGLMAERYGEGLMGWETLREIGGDGVIDVQCHTYDHTQMWIDGEVIDFVRPGLRLPWVSWTGEGSEQPHARPPWGWPILPYRPAFSAARRFIPELDGMRRAAEHVEAHGGEAFFRKAAWRGELCALLEGEPGACYVSGRLESLDEKEEALSNNLARSRALFEQHLRKEVLHLAFPWNEGGSVATRIASELGFRTIVRGKVNESEICRRGQDPLYVPRFGSGPRDQAVLMLPGRGRRSAGRVLLSLIWKRLQRTLAG